MGSIRVGFFEDFKGEDTLLIDIDAEGLPPQLGPRFLEAVDRVFNRPRRRTGIPGRQHVRRRFVGTVSRPAQPSKMMLREGPPASSVFML